MYYFNYLSFINNYYINYYEVRNLDFEYRTSFFVSDRSRVEINDDLTTVRNILHTNILLCLIIVQILFLFGIDQTKTKVEIFR